jgi:hypothetical protein
MTRGGLDVDDIILPLVFGGFLNFLDDLNFDDIEKEL